MQILHVYQLSSRAVACLWRLELQFIFLYSALWRAMWLIVELCAAQEEGLVEDLTKRSKYQFFSSAAQDEGLLEALANAASINFVQRDCFFIATSAKYSELSKWKHVSSNILISI